MRKTTKEFKDKSVKQLEEEEKTLRKEIAKLKLDFKVSPPKDTNALFKKRKKLAVLLTVLNEKRELEKLSKEVKK